MEIDPEDPCAAAKKYFLGQNCASKIDALDSMVPIKNQKKTFKYSDQNLDNALQSPNTKKW